jgi:hypothetical protein
MRASHGRKLAMGVQVREFFRANPPLDESQERLVARLTERLAHADALIAQQRAGLIAEHASAARRRELRRGLQFELLRYLSRVGDAAARVRPELALRFKLPALNTPISTFVHAVRAMIGVAEAEREVLAGVGLSEAALTALKREVAELEQTIKTSGTARAEHVGASSSLADVTREVLNLVGMLDGLNRYRYRGNPELLAEWELATHVRAAARRHLADPQAEDSGAGGSSEGGRGASAA